jgi:preprotein translocase subunit YajC
MTKMSSMISAFEVLAQQAVPPAKADILMQVLPFIFLFGAMYFFMIAPQRKKQKEHEKMLAGLQSGDEIVTTGGIFGTITNVKDDRFVVRVSDNTKLEVGKGFVQTVLKSQASAEKK